MIISKGGYDWFWQSKSQEVYQQYQTMLDQHLSLEIKKKQQANLVLALAIGHLTEFKAAFKSFQQHQKIPKKIKDDLQRIPRALDKNLLYKNIWIHLIDTQGTSLYRSWTDKKGDNLISLREDIREMIVAPKIRTTISVGKYALSLKAMIPVMDGDTMLGMVEVISQLNSISLRLKKELNLASSTILIDPKWVRQLVHKQRDKMVLDFYVANTPVSREQLNFLHQLLNAKKLKNLYQSKHYQISDSGRFEYAYPIQNKRGTLLGKWLIVKKASQITAEAHRQFLKQYFFILAFVFFVLLVWLWSVYKQQQVKSERIYYQTIFNLNSNIMFVANKSEILEVNDGFLAFFNQYENLDAFRAEHDCISDFFKSDGGYIQPKVGRLYWKDYLIQFPQIDALAKIMHPTRGERILKIKVAQIHSKLDQDLYIVSMEDVTEQTQTKLALEYRTMHDELTGLYNRYFFNQNLKQFVAMGERYKHPFSLISFDIDFFKSINDTFGHDIGDQVLKEIAQTVKSNVRNTDLVCRVGGEEFAILMPETALASAASIAEKLRQKVEEIVFESLDHPVTISLGVVELLDQEDGDSLYKRADNAMYQAKEQGRNQVIFDNDY